MAETVYVALGSNLEQPELQLQRAVDTIDSSPQMTVCGCSRLYRSDPVGPPGQPDYCNAVVAITTTLTPLQLLDALQSIENSHGRVRSVRWGPRTLDLDIILFGNQRIESQRLTIPHYQMQVRNFVLCPLLDVAPDLELPDGTALQAMVDKLGYRGLRVIAENYPWI
ncbi:2-amino-4-hydroxy-6-hydroxymethyldihydropteridine diphosphokinase [Endozoicomonas sp. SCSIO W0465]|uniref:2-amino-4-hydroxy-6- hydroxymethyldihydropteridine diphosphokinase n=1 Tax=Endozoicomonas sp. SCSIO W0465 TaxID=2918516 RepID=UPI0020754EEB|nr:2-amino-4-hydroxy-6-hydroxymethyldihydropteridine diphosphokinase [Endozoicomonas sp. SCSIO W0465]USE37761.1 2-amino-4-hydroxy-6-hydroxymethyldihydropteridine diphosphokinase [Endozoicomonas sp. SCSIO W0465]